MEPEIQDLRVHHIGQLGVEDPMLVRLPAVQVR